VPGINHILAPLDHPIGKKINIRGGGGKTTLGKALSGKYGYSFIELDAIFWLPEWIERETDDFRVKTQEAISTSYGRWIVDGNYSGRLETLVTDQCDTVIWIDLPWSVMFWRITLRAISRAISREKICGENIESWRQMFSRDSLLWYLIKNRRSYLSTGKQFIPMVPENVPIIRIRSRKELNRFYDLHDLKR
jgi:adenylate kinase family enzyme